MIARPNLVCIEAVREGSDTQVAGSGVDLVADLEGPDIGADARHGACDIVSEHERGLVLQELLELAVADHLVQRVDAGSTYLDQDVTGPEGGFGHVGRAE